MPYSHIDIVDWNAGVSASPDVVANTAARHNRLHTILSETDHSDVSATPAPSDGDALTWNAGAGRWRAASVAAVADGVTMANALLLMGG